MMDPRASLPFGSLALLLACGLPAAAQSPEERDGGAAAVASLDPVLEPIRDRHGVPALGGATVDAEGRLRGLGAVGVRAAGSEAQVTAEDRWHIGSCTKALTATLLGRLVERGVLSWETTLADALPELAEDMVEAWSGVTLEQLLAHRSGAASARDMDLLALRGSDAPLVARRRTAVAHLTSEPPAAPPGDAFQYSNAGYVAAAAMAEAATGRSWEELLRGELLDPLGMARAGFGPPGSADALDEPRGHRALGDALTPMPPGPLADNPPVLGPAGTVHAPLTAWARFAALHLRGARGEEGLLLQPETFEALHAPRGERYALGWGVAEKEGAGRVLTHDGSNTMWFARAVLAPDAGWGAVVVTNAASDAAKAAIGEAARALLERGRAGAGSEGAGGASPGGSGADGATGSREGG